MQKEEIKKLPFIPAKNNVVINDQKYITEEDNTNTKDENQYEKTQNSLQNHISSISKHKLMDKLYKKPKFIMHRIDNSTPDQMASLDDIPSSGRLASIQSENQYKSEEKYIQKQNVNHIKSPSNSSQITQFNSKLNNEINQTLSQQKNQTNLNMISETIDEEDELRKTPSISSPTTKNNIQIQNENDQQRENNNQIIEIKNQKMKKQLQQIESKLQDLTENQNYNKGQKPHIQKLKKNIFNKHTMEALGVDQSSEKMFGVGPRYDNKGELLDFSIVGKPEWFQKYEGKQQGSKSFLKKQDRKISKLGSDDRKQSIYYNQQTSSSFYNSSTNRRQSRVSEIGKPQNKKRYVQQKEQISKQALLWNLQKIEQNIFKNQKTERKLLEQTSQFKVVSSNPIKTEETTKTHFYIGENEEVQDDERESNLTPYQFIQNMEKTRQQRQLLKIDEQNHLWEQTGFKIGCIQGRPITDTLIYKSADKFREKREFQDLLQKTKDPKELIGDCYWETLLRQHPQSKKEIEKQRHDEEFGLTPDPNMRTLSDTDNRLIKTRFDTNSYEIIRKPNLYSTQSNFNSTLQTMYSSNPYKTAKNQYYMPLVSNNTLTGTNKLSNQTNTILNTNKSFNKSLPSINSTIVSKSSNITNEVYKQSFIQKLSEKPKKLQKNFQNVFELDCEELIIVGENKLQKEKDALVNDGQPGHAVYQKLIEEDENEDVDQYQKYVIRQIDQLNDLNQIAKGNAKSISEHEKSQQESQTDNKFKKLALDMGIPESNILKSPIEQDSFNPDTLSSKYKQRSILLQRQLSKAQSKSIAV